MNSNNDGEDDKNSDGTDDEDSGADSVYTDDEYTDDEECLLSLNRDEFEKLVQALHADLKQLPADNEKRKNLQETLEEICDELDSKPSSWDYEDAHEAVCLLNGDLQAELQEKKEAKEEEALDLQLKIGDTLHEWQELYNAAAIVQEVGCPLNGNDLDKIDLPKLDEALRELRDWWHAEGQVDVDGSGAQAQIVRRAKLDKFERRLQTEQKDLYAGLNAEQNNEEEDNKRFNGLDLLYWALAAAAVACALMVGRGAR